MRLSRTLKYLLHVLPRPANITTPPHQSSWWVVIRYTGEEKTMFKFIRVLFVTIKKELAGVYFPSYSHPANVTNSSTAPAELQYETDGARGLLKKDTQMKVARILTRMWNIRKSGQIEYAKAFLSQPQTCVELWPIDAQRWCAGSARPTSTAASWSTKRRQER